MSDMTPESVTPVSHAVIDEEQLAALVRDLQSLVQIEQIITKPKGKDAPQVDPSDYQSLELNQITRALVDRQVGGVQVRYRYDNALWIDTLTPAADGIRLVRVRHPM